MDDYRSLTVDEIGTLVANGCSAEDWGEVLVAEGFSADYVRDVSFYGRVRIGALDKTIGVAEGFQRHASITRACLRDVVVGDNCLIENIGTYISRYRIGDECYVANVGVMECGEDANFGEGVAVATLNEAGAGNVVVYDALSAQTAALMAMYAADGGVWERIRGMVADYCGERVSGSGGYGTVGAGVKIVNTREIANANISDYCEICGASRVTESTLAGDGEASILIGGDVVIDNSIVQAGASVVDGARVYSCLVGEACHIGKGFTGVSSLFFANTTMDNGEAQASLCGPFTTSHHKATLMIGVETSFFNAGSSTNFSNHAYKMGPIHYGRLGRGSKTASGCHIVLPARIGAFSMCMGKIESHPDTRLFPFSYVVGNGRETTVLPGRNIATAGTYRDIHKWRSRDMRPYSGRRSIVTDDWMSPMVMHNMLEGRRLIAQGEGTVSVGNATVRCDGKGVRLIDMALRMYYGDMAERYGDTLPESSIGTGEWVDLLGMMAPRSEVERVADAIRDGAIGSVEEIEGAFRRVAEGYERYKWCAAYRDMLDYYDIESVTVEDVRRIVDDGRRAHAEWIAAVRQDAQEEYALGDVDESTLNDFLRKI